MKRLETICRDYLNIGEDINFLEIINFWKKYDGYNGDVIFLINFNEETEMINENNIEVKDRDNYETFAFTPKPGFFGRNEYPKYCILYCRVLDSKNSWKYLKIKTNKKTTEKVWKKRGIPLKVLIYKTGGANQPGRRVPSWHVLVV